MTDMFTQKSVRNIELIKPDPSLKNKVGHGGLNQAILEKAQKVIDDNTIDFTPIAMRHLAGLQEALKIVRSQRDQYDTNSLVSILGLPAMQLKANGAMFGYPLVSKISALLIRFLETIDNIDNDSLDILSGFLTSLNAILVGNIKENDKTNSGNDLYSALEDACQRHLNKTRKSD